MSEERHEYVVLERDEIFHGSVFSLYSDMVSMPDGEAARRDHTEHQGAVAVVALDADGQVALIRQYRHAVGERIWELPAGLRDVAGEDPVLAAQRELLEESDLRAATWNPLARVHTSPGYSNELVLIYLARDLTHVPDADRHERHFEEAELEQQLVSLDEAVGMVMRGEITNGIAMVGLLAAARARDEGWANLQPI